MNYFKKNKIISFLVIFLLLINITALLTMFIQGRRSGKPSQENEIERTTHFLKEELQFNDEQVYQFVTLQNEFLMETQIYKKKIGDAKFELYEELLNDDASKVDKEKIYAVISENTILTEKRTLKFMSDMKMICNEEQISQYRMLMGQVLRKLNPEHRPPEGAKGPRGDRPPGQPPMPPERK